MEVKESIHQEYVEFIMESKGWDYPLDNEEAFDLFQRFKKLEGSTLQCNAT